VFGFIVANGKFAATTPAFVITLNHAGLITNEKAVSYFSETAQYLKVIVLLKVSVKTFYQSLFGD
jgi:hypothetical protein